MATYSRKPPAWQVKVPGVAKSQTWLKRLSTTNTSSKPSLLKSNIYEYKYKKKFSKLQVQLKHINRKTFTYNCSVNQDRYFHGQILQLENQLDIKQIFGSLIFQYINPHATSLIKFLLVFSFCHSRKLDMNQPLTSEEGSQQNQEINDAYFNVSFRSMV